MNRPNGTEAGIARLLQQRAEQGFPAVVTDPDTIRKIAPLIGTAHKENRP